MNVLKNAWNIWKKLAEKISIAVNTALLAAVYAAAVAPIAIARKLLVKKKREKSYWKDFEQEDSIEAIRRQF